MSLGLFNCRLIQPARDQLFFFAGCLAAPVPVRASSVQSPCDASCSAPTSGRVRNASCVFPSQEGFVLVFRGSEAPVGCRRVPPTDSPTNSPEDPPILPIDSAIEPDKGWARSGRYRHAETVQESGHSSASARGWSRER